jgi:hypothetical protein
MNDTRDPKVDAAEPEREVYVPPEVRLLGDVVELTRGAGGSNLDANRTPTLA